MQATNCGLVGSAYTYFGISGKLLNKDIGEWPGEAEQDRIPFMAIRFSVRGSGVGEELCKVRKYLGEGCTDLPFRVTGNEDVMICGRNVLTKNLVQLYQSWYRDSKGVFSVFRDIITRIGTDWEDAIREPRGKSDLEVYSEKVLKKVRDWVLKTDLETERKGWLRPLLELTNALVHISHSTTLDEPVFLILPGLNAFWDNVIDRTALLAAEPMYLRFAELCIHTMEHLMRAEGQLSHRPEVRPVTYDIPVFILEYATTFLLMLSRDLTNPDEQNAKYICFILSPGSEADVLTEELFQAKNDGSGLLQITVSFSLLYNPKRLLPVLCHELAHYVGEKLRMRKLRYEKFLYSAAKVMIEYFFGEVSAEPEKLLDYPYCFLYDTIRAKVEENTGSCNEDIIISEPLAKIDNRICGIAKEMGEEESYARLIRSYVLSEYQGARFYSISEQARKDKLISFYRRIHDLSISFRETYADICMLYFLDLSPTDYLDVALRQWENMNTSTYLRVYVSLTTRGDSLSDIQDAIDNWGTSRRVNSEQISRAREEICAISGLIQSEESSPEKYLAEYISHCWSKLKEESSKFMSEEGEGTYTVKKIYEKVLDLKSVADYENMLEIIDYGRQMTLEQLKDVLG